MRDLLVSLTEFLWLVVIFFAWFYLIALIAQA